jgi:probable HAF family extracellular repeat protein
MNRSFLAPGAALALLFGASAGAQVSFRGVGAPSGTDSTLAYGISADGSVVVGSARSGQDTFAFRWTLAGGAVDIGSLPNMTVNGASAVSGDGTIVVGASGDGQMLFEGFRWTEKTGVVGLGDLPGGIYFSNAISISADGATIVGHSASHDGPTPVEAFRWTIGDGMIAMGMLPGGGYSSANACSSNGTIIVGDATDENFVFQAFRWTQSGGMVSLGQLPGGVQSQAFDTSSDGTVIVGTGLIVDQDFNVFARAYRWTSGTGMEDLGQLPAIDPDFGPGTGGNAYAVSPDGKIVVGDAIDGYGQTVAMIWDRHHGLRTLAEVLGAQGLSPDMDGWFLVEAKAVSGTGAALHIAGNGTNPDGYFEGFVATISMCDADYNSDGFIDGIDYDLFNNAFESGDMAADYNLDGFVDGIDYDQFNNDFEAGC